MWTCCLLLVLQGGAPTAPGRCERDRTFQSEACCEGSQRKEAGVEVAQTYVRPGATLPQCVRAERKGQEAVTQDKKLLLKGD